jgi:hypothetical protein
LAQGVNRPSIAELSAFDLRTLPAWMALGDWLATSGSKTALLMLFCMVFLVWVG